MSDWDLNIKATTSLRVARKLLRHTDLFDSVCRGKVYADLPNHNNRNHIYLIAIPEHTKKAVAFALARVDSSSRELYVELLCAAKGFGAGRHMISVLREVAAGLRLKRIRLSPINSARGFYRKMGFRTTEPNFGEMTRKIHKSNRYDASASYKRSNLKVPHKVPTSPNKVPTRPLAWWQQTNEPAMVFKRRKRLRSPRLIRHVPRSHAGYNSSRSNATSVARTGR